MMSKRILGLAALVALLATSCFRVDLSIDVNEDGSGTVESITAIDPSAMSDLFGELGEQFGDELGPVPGEVDDLCAEFTSDAQSQDLPDGAIIEPYEEDGLCGVRTLVDFEDGDDISAALGSSGDSGDFVIERDGDGWRFEATINTDDTLNTGDTDQIPAEMLDGLLGGAEFIVRIKLPGRQVEHNANFLESDGTMVWEIDPLQPQAVLSARTEPGEPLTGSASPGSGGSDESGSGRTLLIIGLILAALVAAGAAFYFLRGKNATPAMATGPGAPSPTGPATAAPVATTPEPQWDAARGAWIQYDTARGAWMQHDEATNQWKDLDS